MREAGECEVLGSYHDELAQLEYLGELVAHADKQKSSSETTVNQYSRNTVSRVVSVTCL